MSRTNTLNLERIYYSQAPYTYQERLDNDRVNKENRDKIDLYYGTQFDYTYLAQYTSGSIPGSFSTIFNDINKLNKSVDIRRILVFAESCSGAPATFSVESAQNGELPFMTGNLYTGNNKYCVLENTGSSDVSFPSDDNLSIFSTAVGSIITNVSIIVQLSVTS